MSLPTDNICLLPLTLWKHLIFSHLDLHDLINLKRSCKTFSKYEDLNFYITIKTKKVFRKIKKKHWNKLKKFNKNPIDFLDKHRNKIIIITQKRFKVKMGCFSNKNLMLNKLKTLNPQIVKWFYNKKDMLLIINEFKRKLYIKGVDEDEVKFILNDNNKN